MALSSIISSSIFKLNYLVFLTLCGFLLIINTAKSDKIIAEVDNQIISEADMDIFIGNLSKEVRALPKDKLYDLALQQLIDNKIIALLARDKRIHKTQEFLTLNNVAEDRILHDIFLKDYLEKEINENSIRQKYLSYIKKYDQSFEARASHILLKTEKEAIYIVSQIKNGKDFSEMAKKHSIGPSAVSGGDLGYFSQEMMVKEFSEVVFNMKINEISSPVKTKFGWHIIKLVNKKKMQPPSIDSLRESLIQKLSIDLRKKIITSGKKKYKVKLYNLDN